MTMIPFQKTAEQTDEERKLLTGLSILIADDSPAIRFVAASALRACGAIVHEVNNGAEALAAAESSRFALLLMDVQMPKLDGLEASRRLRAAGNQVPILALTASSAMEHQFCLAAGMNDVIQKPFTQASLISQVLFCLNDNHLVTHDGQVQVQQDESLFRTESLLNTLSGDKAFMQRMLGIAVQELPFAAQQMLVAYDNGDLMHVGKVAHRVRPCVHGLGIAALTEKLLQIETLANNLTDSVPLGRLIASVAGELERIARQIVKAS
jgi:CheY-like chemotaxis protein